MENKKKLLISFSGGRTSAYMMYWLTHEWNERDNYEIIIIFANTGKEKEETLIFIDKCSKAWGLNIVWVEAKHRDINGEMFSKKGWATRHKVVDFEIASRKGEPFEEMLSNLGIPSTNAPFCSDQLKKKAIKHYLKSIKWKGYYTAIGIRSDEIDRVNEKHKELRLIYPLINMNPKTKNEITIWFARLGFNLYVDPDMGNCDFCWKKDLPRLCRIAKKDRFVPMWWQKMTNKYGQSNPRPTKLKPPFNFFRGNLSANDIVELSNKKEDFLIEEMAKEQRLNGCGESCEAF